MEYRLLVAITIVLWVSTFGSAFLESLPFTTTIVYILIGFPISRSPSDATGSERSEQKEDKEIRIVVTQDACEYFCERHSAWYGF